ncbi:glycosyltransferase [Candidatus Spongiihabitans sp.]|uniref:glycosyltransferase n=1 Tax=Candidatus Spongiihabitans sp. TaxID=3101308 RepID=UPI003C7AA5CC
MRILKVIHGYPPCYNAGSEVYSQTLCNELCKTHEVHVFTREENLFAADGELRQSVDLLNDNIRLHIVNAARVNINYRNPAVEQAFSDTLKKVNPDIVHIGHLNHLSLGIVPMAAKRNIPIVFTLHDFWLMCLRGQFIQYAASGKDEVWRLCDGQEDSKCADRCLKRFYSGAKPEAQKDADYWTQWSAQRVAEVRRVTELIDIFIAPSRHVAKRFAEQLDLPTGKTVLLDYGFERQRLQGRRRSPGEPFTFGYIGTHIPGKGIHHLLKAFKRLRKTRADCRLRIWGRETVNTAHLKTMVAAMPAAVRQNLEWVGEYANPDIVQNVFNRVDAIVVPSIWEENSPLVIHEAQQARVPVITADMGGMAEYVGHEENGLLFAARNPEALAAQMRRFIDNPEWAGKLGQRGYLFDKSGNVPDIESHALKIEQIYRRAITARDNAAVPILPAPWRITFDTNPDHCNYRCTMCEEHSPHSALQFMRRANGTSKRVMPFELIQRNVRALADKGLREIIPSTMGEPLLYKDFEKIIALCEETGVMLNLTTNGSFPRLGAREWAKRLVPITSDVKISWNGAHKETHEAIMQNADWETMLANAKDFIAVRDASAQAGGNRCRVTFQMTFMQTNSGELPDIVRLAASLGVDRVKGHHLWAHFAEIKNQDMRRDAKAVARWNNIVAETRRVARACRLPNGQRVLLDNITEIIADENQWAPTGPCPFLGKEAWVSAQGNFNPCCAPDAERQTLGDFGSLHDTDLLDIWRSNQYQFLAQTYRSRTVCQKCNMRKNS